MRGELRSSDGIQFIIATCELCNIHRWKYWPTVWSAPLACLEFEADKAEHKRALPQTMWGARVVDKGKLGFMLSFFERWNAVNTSQRCSGEEACGCHGNLSRPSWLDAPPDWGCSGERRGIKASEEPLTRIVDSPNQFEAMTSSLLHSARFRHPVCGRCLSEPEPL